MAGLPLTKNALRQEQLRLGQLQKYLPTLQLKKAMLQLQATEVHQSLELLKKEKTATQAQILQAEPLFDDKLGVFLDKIKRVQTFSKHYENVAGVDLPVIDQILFEPIDYNIVDTPLWFEGVLSLVHRDEELSLRVEVEEEKYQAIMRELREVSIRVNLFEKILIPRALNNIKRISIFLSDQQLAAVCRAKVAKKKIEERV